MKKIVVALFFTGSFLLSMAQKDTLWLTDGRYFIVKSVEMNEDSSYKVTVVNGEKIKIKEVEPEEMFVLNKQNGTEKIFYNPGEDDLPFKDMKDFVTGENFAHNNYKPTAASIANFVMSTGISLFLGMHGMVFYSPLGVLIPTVILANINPSVKKFDKRYNDNFKNGYVVAAKHKKTLWLIKAGIAGILTGGGISFIIVK